MMAPDKATTEPGMRRFLWRELLTAGRFGIVGAVATSVHMLVVWFLVSDTDLPVLVANLFAFLTAFGVSFMGHYVLTFGNPGEPVRAMRRFLLISGSAFAINMVLLAGLVRTNWLQPEMAAVSAAVLIPLITFTASRLWGFRRVPPSS